MSGLFIWIVCLNFSPSVVWDGAKYIVNWQGEKREYSGQDAEAVHDPSPYFSIFGDNIRVNCNNSGDQTSPFLVSSGENLYVVWDDANGGGVRFSKSINGGLNWSTSNPWINDNTFPHLLYPSIAIAGNVLDVAWKGGFRFDRSTDYGVTWGTDVCPSNLLYYISSPMNCSFRVNGNTIYMAFLRSPPPPPDFQVYFVKSENGGASWTAAKNISNSPAGTCLSTSLAIDDMNNIYVVWTANEGPIMFTKSTDGGINWATPTNNITDSQSGFSNPLIAARGNGELFAIWNAYPGPWFAKSTDGGVTWTHPNIRIDSISPYFYFPSIDIDNGNIYVAYPDTLLNIYFTMSSDNGGTWKPRERVNDTTLDKRLGPVVAVENTNVYIVWSDKREGTWDIYFSKGKAGVEENDADKIQKVELNVYPNPFTQTTTINYQSSGGFKTHPYQEASKNKVCLKIYDLGGRLVRVLPIHDSRFTTHEISWDGKDNSGKKVERGVYFIRTMGCEPVKVVKLR